MAVIKHSDKYNFLGKGVYFNLEFQARAHHLGKSRKDLQTADRSTSKSVSRAERKWMNVYSCTCLCSAQFFQFKTPCLGNVAAPSGQGLPDRFMNIIPHRHASVGQPNADSPSLRLGSQMIVDCIWLTTRASSDTMVYAWHMPYTCICQNPWTVQHEEWT